MRTAEQIYEEMRPKFRDWGDLKSMCIAAMKEYSRQKCEEQRNLCAEEVRPEYEPQATTLLESIQDNVRYAPEPDFK